MDTNEITTDRLHDIAATWCRMWNEQPALAHELMTEDCVQWSGNTPGLDTVVGPAEQEAFISAYRTEHVNVFVPRVLLAEGDTFAYLWDVTLPDGTQKTGIDVNVLDGGLIRENWTIVGDTRRTEPDPAPGTAADDDELRAVVSGWAATQGYTVHRRPVVEGRTGRVALLRTSDGLGGVDLLTVHGDVVEPIWSITGVRPFRY